MFNFKSEQKTYKISGVEIGGKPEEHPTVLVGSIFYAKHRIVIDPLKGDFNKERAKQLLEEENDLSIQTGNPRFTDVIGDTSEALIKFVEFVAENTSTPILIDSPSRKARIETVKHFTGSKIFPRLIYNSIGEDYTDEELDCLKECKVKSAILLAFGMKAIKPAAKLKLLKDTLVPAAEKAGIENIIVDLGVMDVASISWVSLAIREVKEEFGYPAGCAPANALYDWQKMKARGKSVFQAAAASIISMTRLMGADFCLYGPIENASWVYPAMATIDALISYAGRFSGIQPVSKDHPLYKIF
jgi:tetrahydromethanopterin S-methyltransferase subunit H